MLAQALDMEEEETDEDEELDEDTELALKMKRLGVGKRVTEENTNAAPTDGADKDELDDQD